MEKFSIFDFFNNIIKDKNIQNDLSQAIGNLFNSSKKEKIGSKEILQEQPPKNQTKNLSKNAYLLLLKQHDEISKRIDNNLKNPK